jgi:hypothetical protein
MALRAELGDLLSELLDPLPELLESLVDVGHPVIVNADAGPRSGAAIANS